jgi:hypothetical protein
MHFGAEKLCKHESCHNFIELTFLLTDSYIFGYPWTKSSAVVRTIPGKTLGPTAVVGETKSTLLPHRPQEALFLICGIMAVPTRLHLAYPPYSGAWTVADYPRRS